MPDLDEESPEWEGPPEENASPPGPAELGAQLQDASERLSRLEKEQERDEVQLERFMDEMRRLRELPEPARHQMLVSSDPYMMHHQAVAA